MSVLVMDGPGTGEAIRLRGQFCVTTTKPRAARVSTAGRRADVDPKRVAHAISLAATYAPRCAAMDARFAACVAWGAIWDYHATWKKRIEAGFKTSLSVPGHHIM